MKIKILIVSFITILTVVTIVGLNFLNEGKIKSTLDKNNSNIKMAEKVKEENSLNEEENNIIFSDSEKQEDNDNESIQESKPDLKEETKETKPVIKENQKPVIKEETKPVIKEEPKQEEVKPLVPKPDPVVPEIKEPEEEIDYGYIEAMKEVEYVTEQECLDAGFEKSFNDADNVIGFDVRELYYGGKIIGYKLILRYKNPLE